MDDHQCVLQSSCLSHTHLLMVLGSVCFADCRWPWCREARGRTAHHQSSSLFLIQQESHQYRSSHFPPRLEPRAFQETQRYAIYVMLKKPDCIGNVSAQPWWGMGCDVEIDTQGVWLRSADYWCRHLLIHSQLEQTQSRPRCHSISSLWRRVRMLCHSSTFRLDNVSFYYAWLQ